jgi:hypothetical protein
MAAILGRVFELLHRKWKLYLAPGREEALPPPFDAAQIRDLPVDTPVLARGILRCDRPLTAQISKLPCAYFSVAITRDFERKGDRGWEPASQAVSNNTQAAPFFVEDGSGRVRVSLDPETALVDARQVVNSFEPEEEPRDPAASLGDAVLDWMAQDQSRTLGYRSVENILPVDEPVVVVGVVREYGWGGDRHQGIGAPAGAAEGAGKLIVSCRAAGEEVIGRLWCLRRRGDAPDLGEALQDLLAESPGPQASERVHRSDLGFPGRGGSPPSG